ncbi:MAG: fatty acid desaturase [Deltaproteobacteria bacterium]|nr:fatty acid desaturase [Deltaproteobacteria bacterium]
MSPTPGTWSRDRVHRLSRLIIVLINVAAVGSLALQPEGALAWTADILGRTYLMFLAGVMAHEGSHGHLGRTRVANDWWGRLALVPTWVPYLNFRKTHRLHHARTNIPGEDPDLFVKADHWWEVPLRAVAVPHHWLVWLHERGWLRRRDIGELVVHYLAMIAIYSAVATQTSVARVTWGLVPALILDSMLLWIPFAMKTHEGFSTGAPEARSHNYYGRFLYWFSLGLSMHRVHHLRPGLSWIEILPFVERAPGPWWRRLPFRRDIRPEVSAPLKEAA